MPWIWKITKNAHLQLGLFLLVVSSAFVYMKWHSNKNNNAHLSNGVRPNTARRLSLHAYDDPSNVQEREIRSGVAALLPELVAAPRSPMSGEFVHQDSNIYSLLRGAWSSEGEEQVSYPRDAVPCNEAAYFKWVQHGCCPAEREHPLRITQFDTSLLLEKWRDKKVFFIGDSITQQQLDALLSNARADGIHNVNAVLSPSSLVVTFEDYNATLTRANDNVGGRMYGRGGGILKVGNERMPVTYPTSPGAFEEAVRQSDITYVNFGLHLDLLTDDQTKRMFAYTRQVLEEDMALRGSQHFFRTTFPQHFEDSDGKGGDYKMKRGGEVVCVDHDVETAEHHTSILAKKVFYGSSVKVVDSSDFLRPRGDLHSMHSIVDCSHWCYDYEMWRGIFYLMTVAFD